MRARPVAEEDGASSGRGVFRFMRVHEQRFSVSYDYPVYFGWDVFASDNDALVSAICRKEPSRRHRTGFVVEERVVELWPALREQITGWVSRHQGRIELAAEPLVAPGGEATKNDDQLAWRLQQSFDAWKMDRQSAVVVIGGGAFQDVVGYAASTTHRGLRVVRMPTTVLSQNDSGVGVKNGINALGKKNYLGTFAPPFAVLDDFRFLETLEFRDKMAGIAEAVKVALIKDPAFFQWLEKSALELVHFHMQTVAEMIERCARMHLDHIAFGGDPFELGSSRPLDFGHWAAHKLESLSDYSLRHGEAVSVGIALDAQYSAQLGWLGPADVERIWSLLERLTLPLYHEGLELKSPGGRRVVLDGIDEFREHLGGELTVMMLERIGKGREVNALDEAEIDRAVERLSERNEPRLRAKGPAAARAIEEVEPGWSAE